MTTVTGLTAERMLEIEAASVVDGEVIGNDLILTKHDGGQINAGNVRGPTGAQGPVGSDLDVISAVAVSDVGVINQIRAGRQLTLADFTALGLSAPIGLWNLASTADSSGNGRTLINKGTVTFALGINGAAGTAAQFTGAVGQAFYIADTGAADPFRIKVGSIGCWFRTPNRGVIQSLITKRIASPNLGYAFSISTGNVMYSRISYNGTTFDDLFGQTDVCDNRWHFSVMTFDGILRKVYVDGIIEASTSDPASFIFPAAAPFNIGGYGADAATNAAEANFGRMSNGFVTADILTDDQVRNLYCAKIPHTLAALPGRVTLNVRRGRKGAALVTGDFPSSPLRLYNFSAGSLGNAGSQGAAGDLTNVGGAGSGAGADGTPGNGMIFGGTSGLTSSDTGLPAGTAAHSFGCWIKTAQHGSTMYLINWGTTNGTNDARMWISTLGEVNFSSGADNAIGPQVCDGELHFLVVVHDNAAVDGLKRKLYVDGRTFAVSSILNSIVLGGAGKFAIGQSLVAGSRFNGLIDTGFVIGGALTLEDVIKLYSKSSQLLAVSPKNPGDHIEAMSTTDLLAIFDTLSVQDQVELMVAA